MSVQYHAWTHRTKSAGGTDPLPVVLYIKVTQDEPGEALATGDAQFVFLVGKDMGRSRLSYVETFVTTTSSSGNPTVQIRNITQAEDLLSTPCVIEAGDLNSKDATTQPVIDPTSTTLAWGDHLGIDVDVAGSGAKGLGVYLTFAA